MFACAVPIGVLASRVAEEHRAERDLARDLFQLAAFHLKTKASHFKLTLKGIHDLKLQGLFVPYARVGSGDPVRVLRLFHNKYTGYCCIHLLCRSMYNLSLPRLSANYYGLPTTVQLRAAHKS